MKKYLKFINLFSSLLAFIGAVLIISTTGIVSVSGNQKTNLASGVETMFGNNQLTGTPLAVISFFFALIVSLASLVISFLFIKKAAKNESTDYYTLLSCCLFYLLSGILTFCVASHFASINGLNSSLFSLKLGGGYITAGVLFLISFAIGLIDPIIYFLDLKNKSKAENKDSSQK
ncbi:MAG: hypothetical protein SPJ52_05150 [Candidatus Enterosoma sp.]|nr:hypothetical protein [bacterium]MDY5866503.1 hypothetical protein [Candidatus Enterosoma sp.]